MEDNNDKNENVPGYVKDLEENYVENRSVSDDVDNLFQDNIDQDRLEEAIDGINIYDSSHLSKFEVDQGTAADVAYLVWESQGTVTANDISSMSDKEEYSAVDSITTREAKEGLRAVEAAGLTGEKLPSHGFSGLGEGDPFRQESFSFQKEMKNTDNLVDLIMDNIETYAEEVEKGDLIQPFRYTAGDCQQFKQQNVVTKDPQEAFQRIGEGFQRLDFGVSPYLKIGEEILEE
jgi:hypothetical protein